MARISTLRVAFATALLLVGLLVTPPAQALCVVCDPAAPVPADRYEPDGKLAPADILGDLTWYKEDFEPGCAETNWFDLDIEAGWMFTATGNAVEIWDVRDSASPALTKTVCRPVLGAFKKSDQDFYHLHIDAPPGNPNIVAVGVEGSMGLVVLNTTNKNSPVIAYQDEGETTVGTFLSNRPYSPTDLATTHIGNADYAFVATGLLGRVAVYNLTAAASKDRCLASEGCGAGVYLGTPGSYTTSFVLAAADKYLVLQNGNSGINVLDVSNPIDPVLVAQGGPAARDVAIWKQNGKYRVAVSTGDTVEIYDLVCSGGACSLNLWKRLSTPKAFLLTASKDGGIPYLFVGISAGLGRIGGPQLEYLYDLSGSVPEELTPQQSVDGYWGWYYEGNPTGFRRVAPYAAEMSGGHLFRAAVSLLDSHERRGVSAPPVADFSWSPSTIYPSTAVSFTDASSGSPTAWDWSFTDANVSSSTAKNPSGIQFLSKGSKNVSLTATNAFGPGAAKVRPVTVLDPVPSLTGISGAPSPAFQCSTVQLTPSGAKGQPPLGWSWSVKDGSGTPVPGATGTTADGWAWTVPSDLAPGTYTAQLDLSNASGAASKSTSVMINARRRSLPQRRSDPGERRPSARRASPSTPPARRAGPGTSATTPAPPASPR